MYLSDAENCLFERRFGSRESWSNKTKERILYMLEQYKFRTNIEIAEAMKIDYNLVVTTDIEENTKKIQILGNKVLIFEINPKTIIVYLHPFKSYDLTSIELSSGVNSVTFQYLTPFTFELVVNGIESQVEPDLLLGRILMEALKLNATDLHFGVKHYDLKPIYSIEYRRDGMLFPLELFILDARLNKEIVSKLIASKTDVSSLDLTDSAGVTASASNLLGDDNVELRISANKVKDGFHCVIRIQSKKTVSKKIIDLGFSEEIQDVLKRVAKKRSGFTPITGAIRTGKNTTAFAIANEMAQHPIKIISYESPIEALMPFPQVDYFGNHDSLLNAVRLAKKQDVNVAFINEIPDKNVAFAVQDLVNSSIHVVATMHMNRVWHLPYKLKEYYGDAYKDIISQINVVLNQKMFGQLCPFCQQKRLIYDLVDLRKKQFLENYGVVSYSISCGCIHCTSEYVKGIIPGVNRPYLEYVEFTDELRGKLLECSQPYQMETILKEYAMQYKTALEFQFIAGIKDGKLSLDALDSIF